MEILRENYIKIGIPDSPEMMSGSIRILEEAGFSPVDDSVVFPRHLWVISNWRDLSLVCAELNFIPEEQILRAIASQDLEVGIIYSTRICRNQPEEIRKRLRIITGLPPLYYNYNYYDIDISPTLIGQRELRSIDDPIATVELKLLGVVSAYERRKPPWAEKYDR